MSSLWAWISVIEGVSACTVVWRFFGDLHVVNVRLGNTGTGDLDELGLGAHFLNVAAAGVAHGGAQSPHQLVHDGTHHAFVGHATFDAFRYQLLGTGVLILEVAVGTALALGHGAHGTHATIRLVGTALVQLDFTGGFFGTGQQPADHDRTGASSNRFGQVTGVAHPAVSDQRNIVGLEGLRHAGNGADLRHANTRYHTGGTDGAGTDTHFHAVGAGFGQCLGGGASGDVAADHLNLREVLLDPLHAVDYTLGVAVSGIHDDDINAGFGQRRHPVRGFRPRPYRRPHEQATVGILGGVGEGACLFNILESDQTAQLKLLVDHQHFLDPVFLHPHLDHVEFSPFRHRYQTLTRGHDVGNAVTLVGLKAHVTLGDDTYQVFALYHRKAGETMLLSYGQQVFELGFGTYGHRILDDHALVLFDLANFCRLGGNTHVLVHDANPALLRHGNGQAGFGHGIHGGGDKRNIEVEIAGEAGSQVDVLGQDIRVAGDK